jgi:FKBP-type peptidyl-prolyl cis-trans isomerase
MMKWVLIFLSLVVFGDNFMSDSPFYNDYAKNEDVVKTKSGLLYKVLKKGSGSVNPTESQVVTVHYEGKLTDGTVFDSSFTRGVPAKFGVNQVIPGWVEGLQLMSEGDEYEFVIPSNLAYGQNGIPNVIPPNSILIFKVNLIEIQ